MILLDTHVLRWLADGDRRLGIQALEAIKGDRECRASAISYWELGMLGTKGKLVFSQPVAQWLDALLRHTGMKSVPVTAAIAADAGTLPGTLHGDPADRMLIATARAIGCPLATADRKILDYARAGHVLTIDARR
ncbi:type II toxin-antitoxin system VapC family toxin [uncultured Sphingomonas sp.]|uniref:type II toxin-antitoxin system VapC family toxin n=1 Tax=uncultured Sphingomonas sp. TaxID=158754 RepID=UPI0035CAF2A7